MEKKEDEVEKERKERETKWKRKRDKTEKERNEREMK
jgi:hypothetical protein